jgi:hypothetical protein
MALKGVAGGDVTMVDIVPKGMENRRQVQGR